MILYLDTSALVKLYFEEPGDELVVAAVHASTRICTSSIAWVETRATFDRKWRDGNLDDAGHEEAVAGLASDWTTFARLNVSNALAYHAGDLAQEFALRGYDAVHLATALRFVEQFGEMSFLAFDRRLVDAARQAGLSVYGDT